MRNMLLSTKTSFGRFGFSAREIIFASNKMLIYAEGTILTIRIINPVIPEFSLIPKQKTRDFQIQLNKDILLIYLQLPNPIIRNFGVGYKEDVYISIVYKYATLINRAESMDVLYYWLSEFEDKQADFRIKVYGKSGSLKRN